MPSKYFAKPKSLMVKAEYRNAFDLENIRLKGPSKQDIIHLDKQSKKGSRCAFEEEAGIIRGLLDEGKTHSGSMDLAI